MSPEIHVNNCFLHFVDAAHDALERHHESVPLPCPKTRSRARIRPLGGPAIEIEVLPQAPIDASMSNRAVLRSDKRRVAGHRSRLAVELDYPTKGITTGRRYVAIIRIDDCYRIGGTVKLCISTFSLGMFRYGATSHARREITVLQGNHLSRRFAAETKERPAGVVDVGAPNNQRDHYSECAKSDQRQSTRPIPHIGGTSWRNVGYEGPDTRSGGPRWTRTTYLRGNRP